MGAVTDAISAMKVQQWGRTTMADGQWLQEKTFNQLNARDIRLANEIDSINERIPTSGSSYDGLIPWITDDVLERNPLYVITDGTGTRLQNGASGDKQFYVAPSFFNNDDGKVFGIKDGKAQWVTPFNGVKIDGETTTDISKLQFYKKGAGTYQIRLNNPAGEDVGSLPPTPDLSSENKVPTVHKDGDRYYYYLEQCKDYRLKDLNPPSNSNVGKVLTVTSAGKEVKASWEDPAEKSVIETVQYDMKNIGTNSFLLKEFACPTHDGKYPSKVIGSFYCKPINDATSLSVIPLSESFKVDPRQSSEYDSGQNVNVDGLLSATDASSQEINVGTYTNCITFQFKKMPNITDKEIKYITIKGNINGTDSFNIYNVNISYFF